MKVSIGKEGYKIFNMRNIHFVSVFKGIPYTCFVRMESSNELVALEEMFADVWTNFHDSRLCGCRSCSLFSFNC